MLMRNFARVYNGNRAPWGLYMHAAWFFGSPWHFEGYRMFLKVGLLLISLRESEQKKSQEISTYDDVWIVPVKDGLEYMKSPVSNEELISAGPFQAFLIILMNTIINRVIIITDNISNQL